jgi:hypothetical protein
MTANDETSATGQEYLDYVTVYVRKWNEGRRDGNIGQAGGSDED